MIGTKEQINMENITIRKLINSADLEKVYQKLYEKHTDPYGLKGGEQQNSLENIRIKFGDVCLRLLLNVPKKDNPDLRIEVGEVDYGEGKITKVYLPEVSWPVLGDMSISIAENFPISQETLLTEILFELTFWGYSEEEIEAFFNSVEQTNIYEV